MDGRVNEAIIMLLVLVHVIVIPQVELRSG